MPTLATTFRAILAGLQAAIAPYVDRDRDRARTAFLFFIWQRIGRTATRFENLFARWRNGTLPKPRTTPRPPRPITPTTPAPPFRLPRSRAWLIREMQCHHVNGRAGTLEYFLANPDLPEFLAAAPQARRLLRPLCHMLGLQMPGDPRWPDPKPSPAPKPAKTPFLPLPPVPETVNVRAERSNPAYYHPIFSKAR